MRKNLLLFLTMVALLSVFVVIFSLGDGNGNDINHQAAPRAQQGTMDLRGFDLSADPILNLVGDWEIYWRRFVAPKAIRDGSAPPPDGLLSMPGSWQGMVLRGEATGGTGFATLRLRIMPPATQAPLALRLVGSYPANRLWVNGELASETGRIAERPADEVMNHALQIIPLPSDGQSIELVLQVSNFHLPEAGTTPIQFGRRDQLDALQWKRWALAMISVGTLLLMSFYHLTLYLFRRSNPSPLYFALYCLLWTGNILCVISSEWAIRIFWPEAPGELLFRIWPLCIILISPIATQFYRSLYPDEFPLILVRVLWAISLAYTALAVLAPIPVLVSAMRFFYLLSAARMIFSAWALFQAARRNRPGALIIFDGYLLLLVLAANDMLFAMDVIHTFLTLHLGMIVFMFVQALALASRFSTLFSSVEKLSDKLAKNNQVLAAEITQRSLLQQEVVSISEEERRRISHELHDGLCQLLTGARLQCSVLLSRHKGQSEEVKELGRLSGVLEESVDHAYELSRGLWPTTMDSEDLRKALADLVRRQGSGDLAIEFHAEGHCGDCVAPHAQQIYGIAREAITNVKKHAGASKIVVRLDCTSQNKATLSITDDGHGYKPTPTKDSARGLGLRIMIYRAQMAGGTFRIDRHKEGGSCVTCSVPCNMRPPPSQR